MLKKKLILPIFVLFAFLSCSSGDSGNTKTPDTTQSTLVINAEIMGTTAQLPNGNGTGVVNFSITSDAAISYKVTFGDDTTLDTTSKVFSHTYTSSGTKTFVMQVSAFDGLKYFSTTKSIVLYVATAVIWSDEFDVDGAPNSSKWGYDLGGGGWGNNELQYYTNRPENSVVSNGTLKIITLKESYGGNSYTSARLLSKGKFSFKYGRVDVRAKLSTGVGTWPAIWMLGDNVNTVGWPICGEIDIMEHLGRDLNVIHGTLHSENNYGGNGKTGTVTISNSNTEFHIYSLDWSSTLIRFYVDNNLFASFPNTSSLPFNANFFLILNNAMGGWGGTVDPNFTSSTFEVDYVRVYN